MRNASCRTWNMARKFENHGKCEIHTLGREIRRGKLNKVENLDVHCRTWNMARKLKFTENENNTR